MTGALLLPNSDLGVVHCFVVAVVAAGFRRSVAFGVVEVVAVAEVVASLLLVLVVIDVLQDYLDKRDYSE